MFDELLYWHWWVIAVVLFVLELVISGAFFFLWLGAAALLVGLLAMVPGVTWEIQLFSFAVLAVVSVWLWHRFKPMQKQSEHPTLNRRGQQYVGHRFVLAEPIVNGVGKLVVADTIWKITGPDMAANTQVTVTRVEGTALHVERTEGDAGS